MADPEPAAYVDEFGGDAIVVRIQYWVGNPRDRDVLALRSAYARELKERLEAAAVTISPPSKRDLEGRIELAEDA
jgi:small conductance mechanosensitive channel